ncbi:MAG: hypothetical protein ACRD8Z_18100 [Nitrososphaeraceae archaeon]
MNKRSTVIIVSGIAATVIIGLAISIHLRLSALEPEGHKEGETAEEVMNEILTGQPAHSGEGEKGDEGQVQESERGHTEEGNESFHSENETSEEVGHEETR